MFFFLPFCCHDARLGFLISCFRLLLCIRNIFSCNRMQERQKCLPIGEIKSQKYGECYKYSIQLEVAVFCCCYGELFNFTCARRVSVYLMQ